MASYNPRDRFRLAILNHRPRYSVPTAKERKQMPILSLPEEVLAQIFRQCQIPERRHASPGETPSSEDSWTSNYVPPVHMEVILSHVCSWFRYVVLSAPIFWSNISLNPNKHVDEVSAYIVRSNNCTLNVIVNSLDEDDELTCAALSEIFEILVPHIKRCKTLRIKLTREYTAHPIVWRLKDLEAPELEELFISVGDVDFVDTSDGFESGIFLGGTPQLTTVGLRGFSTFLFSPPLPTVTTLHFEQNVAIPISYHRFYQTMTRPRVLTHLSVYGDVGDTSVWPIRGIELPHLRSLRICGISGSIYSTILVAIVAPDLESLVLKDLHERDLNQFWFNSNEMHKFSKVKHLAFQDVDVSTTVHKKFLAAFPDVVTFSTTRGTDISGLLLKTIEDGAIVEGHRVPWPKLNTLVLLDDIYSQQDDLLSFVQKRKDVGHPITTVRLVSPDSLSDLHDRCLASQNVALEGVEDEAWLPNSEALYGEE